MVARRIVRKACTPQIIKIALRRRQRNETSCVDDTRAADGHTVRTYEIQVTVNAVILNSVDRTLNINTVLYQINKTVRF